MANLQFPNGVRGLLSEDLEFVEVWFHSKLFKNLVSEWECQMEGVGAKIFFPGTLKWLKCSLG